MVVQSSLEEVGHVSELFVGGEMNKGFGGEMIDLNFFLLRRDRIVRE
jgi:sorbitol-specific phosphotransferase system component IIA